MTRKSVAHPARLPAFVVLFLAAVCGMTGCSRKGDVYGTVTYNGKPVVYGTVSVIGVDGIQRNSNVQPDGYYEVFDVPAGSAKITIVSPDPEEQYKEILAAQKTPEAAAQLKPPNVDRTQWFPISSSYGNPDSSGIVCEVKSGHNEFNIPLERPAETPSTPNRPAKDGDKGKDKNKDKDKGKAPLTPVSPRVSGGN